MKAFLFFILFTCACHASVNEERLLRAIAEVEGGTRMGKAGELGRWQMGAAAVGYTGGYQYKHALAWLRHLELVLSNAGVDLNTFNLALAWNCGPANVLHSRAPIASYHYAESVTNCYAR